MFRLLSHLCLPRLNSTTGVSNGAQLACQARRLLKTSTRLHQNDSSIRNSIKYSIQVDESAAKAHVGSSNVQLDDLELEIDGKKITLNLTWLRDSCHCPQCTHQYSRQRLFNIKDFRRDMFTVSKVELTPANKTDSPVPRPANCSQTPDAKLLSINWTDGHKSVYSVDWLKYVDSLYSKPQLNNGLAQATHHRYPNDDFYLPMESVDPTPDYWNVSDILAKLYPIDYSDLVDGFKFSDDVNFINANRIDRMSAKRFDAMLNLTRQMVTLGLAKVINVPKERNQVLQLVKSLAYERPTGYGLIFDVVVEPSEEINLAYSSLEFDLHSDLTYREMSPGVQLLHCIRNSAEGGLSYFSDAFRAASILQQESPELFDALVRFPATFVVRDPYRNVKFRHQKPVISVDYQGHLSDVYYSPFMLPPVGFRSDIKQFYLGLDRLTQLLQSMENKLIVKMDPGDLFMFHNRRVLHGRSAYDATTSGRFLQGCYMDWDEMKCLHEKLQSHRNKH